MGWTLKEEGRSCLCTFACIKHQLGVAINILFCAIYSVYCTRQSQSISSSLYTLDCVIAWNVDLSAAVTGEVGRERERVLCGTGCILCPSQACIDPCICRNVPPTSAIGQWSMEEQTLILCLCGSLSATITWPPSYAEMGSVWSIKEGVVMIFGDGRHWSVGLG